MGVRVCFYLLGTISGKTTVHARTYGPHNDQRPVQIKQNMISEVLTKCKGKVKDSVGFGLACTDEGRPMKSHIKESSMCVSEPKMFSTVGLLSY